MEFRVLGPVEVEGDHGPVALGGPHRRLLLALLLARSGAPCPATALADGLWGDSPPPAATTVLHAQVSRLRKLLEPDRPARSPALVLRSVGDGYLIDLSEHSLDAAQFVALVDRGLESQRAGDAAGAKDLLTEALSRWRGPAFGELGPHPALLAAAVELDEKRVSAREALIDARLQLGEHGELIAALEHFVREHPFRERGWAQLMLALYRAGRQADALGAYQRCRRQLIDELGIEPGPELQGLDEAILLQKPELDWQPAAPPTKPAVEVHRPPPAPRTTFVGRDVEIAEVIAALEDHRLITITGPGGVGKTRLAVEVAGRIDLRFHHGIAFCDLVALPGSEHVEGAVADALAVREPLQTGRDRLVDHLTSRELLLVIDNADHVIEGVAALADRLLDACPRLRLVVTSREPLRAAGERLIRLLPLPADDTDAAAVALLVDRAALSAPGIELDRAAALALCQRLDGLPLAIELAASRLRSIPLAHLTAGLDDRLSAISGAPLPRGATSHGTLRDVVDWSVDVLDGDRRALVRRLAVFAGGCTAAAAAIVCDIPDDPVEALGALVDRSLVELAHQPDGHRYRLLETIRADGLTRLAEHGELDRVHARHLAWCLTLVPVDPSQGEDPDFLAGLTPEMDNVVAALAWSLGGGDVVGGVQLAVAAAPWWVHAGRFLEARTWLERAVATSSVSSPAHAVSLRWLGWVLARQSDLGAARRVLGESLERAETLGDDELTVDVELVLARVEIEAGALVDGETRLRARGDTPIVETVAHRRAVAGYALGRRALMAGELPQAAALLERAVEEARSAGLWYTLVQALAALSQAESGRRRLPRAQGALTEALAVARRRRLLGLMPTLLGSNAMLAYRAGDPQLGESRFNEALAAARLVGDLRAELSTLANLGVTALNSGRPVEAIDRLEDALRVAARAGDERTAPMIMANLAEAVLAGTHDTRRALNLATDALSRARAAGLRIAAVMAAESAVYALIARAGTGDLERAAVLLGAASAERDALDHPDDSEATSPIERAREQLRDGLGADGADAAFARGYRLGLESAGELLVPVG